MFYSLAAKKNKNIMHKTWFQSPKTAHFVDKYKAFGESEADRGIRSGRMGTLGLAHVSGQALAAVGRLPGGCQDKFISWWPCLG